MLKSKHLVIIFVVIVVAVWFFSTREKVDPRLPTDPFPVFDLTTRDMADHERSPYVFTEIKTKGGEVVRVRDLKTNRQQVGDEAYVLAGGQADADNERFDIVFHSDYDFIQISLEAEPLAEVRRLAEENLRVQLGVDAELMCEMDISVRTRMAVNPFYAGQELGLSFCPGSVALE